MVLALPLPIGSKVPSCDERNRRARLTAALGVYGLLAVTSFLAGCEPATKLPLTGDVNLQFVRKSKAGIHFRLANQSVQEISFRGTRASPWDTQAECKKGDSGFWPAEPFALVDGGPDSVEVSPGEQVELIVNDDFTEEHKGERCRMNLRLRGGRFIASDEFEP